MIWLFRDEELTHLHNADGVHSTILNPKAHLLRLMVDKILTDSPTVRDQINEHYNLGSQKTAKRTADKNPLVIEKLGNDKLKRHWWQLDGTFDVSPS